MQGMGLHEKRAANKKSGGGWLDKIARLAVKANRPDRRRHKL
jgi:hypothetical protein